MSSKPDVPLGLDRPTHVDLTGRGPGVWARRGGLLLVAAVPAVALTGALGQNAVVTSARTPAATLTVDSPAHLRGGLMFTTEITVQARSALQDMKLRLDRGWFAGMVFNGIAPQPSNESSDNGQVVYDYGSESSGTFKIWISWQANPTNVGRHRQDVALYDGSTRLAVVHRDVTVFP
jgi:hypothetical protein